MGRIHAIDGPINEKLPDNKNSAFQFTYKLETPIKDALFSYLTNAKLDHLNSSFYNTLLKNWYNNFEVIN